MRYAGQLIEGTLIRRYKRFLADVRLADGSEVTAHAPNTGSMIGCDEPGSRVWLLDTGNPKRKYPLSWELVEVEGGVLVGTNTGLANGLVREGIETGVITELQGYDSLRPEVPYGNSSRIDLLLEDARRGRCYVEVKNVTMAVDGIAYFPDSVSERATRHLLELRQVVADGDRAVVFFCVQRRDAGEVRPADDIDELFGSTLRQVVTAGVEPLAYAADIGMEAVRLKRRLPVVLP